jgi:hypothetical protein
MDSSEFGNMMTDEFHRVLALQMAKGRDYAREDDALANFKTQAAALDLTPEQVWAVFAGKHWAAIMAYAREGDVKSEPIEGRIHDLILYGFLLLAMVREAGAEASQIEGGPAMDCLAEDVEKVTAGWEKWQVRQVLTPDPRDPETFGSAWLTVESVERDENHKAVIFVISGAAELRWAVPRDQAVEVREAL